MTLKIAVVSIFALTVIAVPYYLLNKGSVLAGGKQDQKAEEEVLRNKAQEAEKQREAENQSCMARVEAEYVADVQREYTDKFPSARSRGGYDLNPEIRSQIEQKQETAAADCRKAYGPTTSSTP